MQFQLFPVLKTMAELYASPRDGRRFARYLRLLQGDSKRDMLRPIVGYNPMGNAGVLAKVEELIALDAELLMAQTLENLSVELTDHPELTIRVALNVADDLGGAWSQRHLTDYSSKFDFKGLLNRHFCAPYVWTSETYTKELVVDRTRDYALRTYYWLTRARPETLAEHVTQEDFVRRHSHEPFLSELILQHEALAEYYHAWQATTDYDRIFDFFYGETTAAAYR